MLKNNEAIQHKLKNCKSLSLEHTGSHGSLIEEAEFDHHEVSHNGSRNDLKPNEKHNFVVIFSAQKEFKLSSLLCLIENLEAVVVSVTKRESKAEKYIDEIMLELRGDLKVKEKFEKMKLNDISNIRIENFDNNVDKVMVPHSIEELENCSELICKSDPSNCSKHPGWTDKTYRERREKIAAMALNHRVGNSIERVEYNQDEINTWKYVYEKLRKLYKTHACKQHQRVMTLLEEKGLYSPDHIPQLQDVSNFLRNKTGYRLKPVGGIVSSRDFLASLAFRVFQSTQYVRHPSKPEYSIEPDCIHELLGHVPMLADPEFATFSQQIGIASLGCSDEEIDKLSTLYWFTVEYGLCKEGDSVKAYGAGLLTAFGELQHALTDKAKKLPFNVNQVVLQNYDDQDFQEVYFVAESFEDMKSKVIEYTKTIKKRSVYQIDPYTYTLEDLSDPKSFDKLIKSTVYNLNLLNEVLQN